MSWLGLPTFTGYDNLTLIYSNSFALNMEEYDEHYIPIENEWREEEMEETQQYWSNFPQWRDETTEELYYQCAYTGLTLSYRVHRATTDIVL